METIQGLGGLTGAEAKKRLQSFGPNEIEREKKVSAVKIFISQFTSPLIIILILAAIALWLVSRLTEANNFLDVALIIIIVLISGISGFFQDYKAERSIEALQKLSSPKSRVIRDGHELIINSAEIVPGDILVLESGDVIPADAKIIEEGVVKVDEAILTGESSAVKKNSKDEIYMNTYVVIGKTKAIVTRTGMNTKIGEIAGKLETIVDEKTPFYIEMNKLSKKLFWLISTIAVITALAGLVRYTVSDSILSAIALAVAAIPEGLPAVLVLSLAAGAQIMYKKKALVRKLGVIESMGSLNIICTDKTGTLTKNKMEVSRVFANNKEYTLESINKEKIKDLLICGALNNNVREITDEYNKAKLIGDETEIAVYNFSKLLGQEKHDLEKRCKRIYEVPFDPHRKMMSVVCASAGKKVSYTKGAPEVLLKKCEQILIDGKVRKITAKDRKMILEANEAFASKTLRVLGFAFKKSAVNVSKNDEKNEKEIESNLIWIGLEAMRDPPRDGVKDAIQQCKDAGIRVIVLTGDNPITAKAISNEIGVSSSKILIGKDVDQMTDPNLLKQLNSGTNIFARLTPDHKFRIMKLLQDHGNVVGMTGDGVNDALALKKADVGIAMGIRGTDVAKQASDLILLDDNFTTIVSSVKEGRRVFDNIRKFVNYLLTSNIAEVAVIFFATLFITLKDPILLPVQLLWINLLTDGLPALALGVDPARPRVMSEPPRKKNEGIIDKKLTWLIFLIGAKKTIILFATFLITRHFFGGLIARTTLFTGFVLYEFVRIGVIRSQEKLTWFSNKWLVAALALSIALQLGLVYSPAAALFGVVPLGIVPWIILLSGVAIGYFAAIFITNLVVKYVK